MTFQGSMVALVTPMQLDGSIDKKSLAALVEWHIASHTRALIIAGTTGESATLDPEEHLDLLSFAVKQAAGRIPVIAGTGTNATRSTLRLCENAQEAGADACLVVTPYYNRPTQKGLYEHYKTVADASALPIILYNVPGRTGCDLLPETVAELSKIKNIIGVKEAVDKLERIKEIIRLCDLSFKVYSGNDATAMETLLHGGHGVISVTANIAPLKMSQLCDAAMNGQAIDAFKLNEELALLHQRLFLESNPIPTKWALHHMGKIEAGIRLPLLPLDSQYHEEVKEAMQKAGVE